MSGLMVKVPNKKQVLNEPMILTESVNVSPDKFRRMYR